MTIRIQGAREHKLKNIDVEFGDGLTVVTGVSGSGKTSLVFDTVYHEARRRFADVFERGSASGRSPAAEADSVEGLGPAVAIGQNLLNRNPNSTLATASGLHPFLRLLYARYGERSCERCGAPLSVLSEDEIAARLRDGMRRGQALLSAPLVRRVPGSHSTLLRELEELFGAERITIDGAAWNGQALKASAPHDIEVLLLEGAAAAGNIRDALREAAALGVNAVTLRRGGEASTFSRAPVCPDCGAWFGELRPTDFNGRCPACRGAGCGACAGTGLPPRAAAVHWSGARFDEILGRTVDGLAPLFAEGGSAPLSPRLRTEIAGRLDALARVGLGYVGLDRTIPTLSRGEAQRVRLALALVGRLEDLLHVLDEPTVGQHPADVGRLVAAFRELAGPVIFVEHDRHAAAAADTAIDLGPGAGNGGGRVVFRGTPEALWKADTATGRYFSLRDRVRLPTHRPPPADFIVVRGARLRNLDGIDVRFPVGRLTVVTGVSGSGKSTLVEDVLVASLNAKKPQGCRAVEGLKRKPLLVDQSPIGRNPRSNPATYTKLADVVRDLFASGTGLSPSRFSFNRPEGACPACGGLGAIENAMRYLPSEWTTCAECGGRRFSDEVLDAKIEVGGARLSIADFYELSVAEVRDFFRAAEGRIGEAKRQTAAAILDALCDIGLGYLELGQPSPSLSGGEAQRIKLARSLGKKAVAKELLVLDEPSTGLHPADLAGLIEVLGRLASAGATIVVVEHDTDLIRAADWVVDLGPGAGPEGGRLLYEGSAEGLKGLTASPTGRALADEDRPRTFPPRRSKKKNAAQNVISIRGARANNLRGVDVDIPKGRLTVVTGLSGSGKSSLVRDVLEVEARRRYLETLSLYERQGTREGSEAEVDSIAGLGTTLSVGPERVVYARRSTVGTATELGRLIAALLSAIGERRCLDCGAKMERGAAWACPACGARARIAAPRHFDPATYAAACVRCNGIGSTQVPAPSKLVVRPDLPLVRGALHSPGFFPDGYLGKPFNGGYYLLQALGARYGFDPQVTTWNAMTEEARRAFLFGTEETLVVRTENRAGRVSVREAKFPGFYGFIRDWDVGGLYTDAAPCPDCGGARLRPDFLAVTLAGRNSSELSDLTLVELARAVSGLEAPRRDIASILDSLRRRLAFLIDVGLGYLHLDRVAGTLSAGEVQRVRLAGLLGSGLTSLTVLADEPTRGLHPCEVGALIAALKSLRDEGNTVVLVEHDAQTILAADHVVDMGPDAGPRGGKVVAQGSPVDVARSDGWTGRWLRGERGIETRPRRAPTGTMTVLGARANNLKGGRVDFPLGVLLGVCGVSGSGKSTLVTDTIARALAPRVLTTSVAYEPIEPGAHDAIEGAPARTVLVDQTRSGIGSPAAYLDLVRPLQKFYAETPDAKALGLTEERLATRCSACGGRGQITHDMAFLPDLRVVCETCRGTGCVAEAWDAKYKGMALPEAFGLTLAEALETFGDLEGAARALMCARDVGLGYLVLRQPGTALSGGEAQRLKIAAELRKKAPAGSLYLLDEPSTGQHMEDTLRLVGVLHRLVDEGASVVVVEHNPHILASCDRLIELGLGGGPDGGSVIAEGTPEELAAGSTPIAPYLREVLRRSPSPSTPLGINSVEGRRGARSREGGR